MASDVPIESLPHSGPSWVFEMCGFPWFWLNKADELHRAASVLLDQMVLDHESMRYDVAVLETNPEHTPLATPPDLWDTFMFLESLAIENLLKGLFVRSNPDCLRDGRLRGDKVTSHDLSAIAVELGIDLTDDELAVIQHGMSCIQSWGRYPIAKDQSKMYGRRTVRFRIVDTYAELIGRLSADLKTHPIRDPACDSSQPGDVDGQTQLANS